MQPFYFVIVCTVIDTSILNDSSEIVKEKRHSTITFLSKPKLGIILTSSFCSAFIQISFTWMLNVSLKLILTPRSFTHALLAISWFSAVRLAFWLELQIKWHLSAFAFILLSENHWKCFFDIINFGYHLAYQVLLYTESYRTHS